MKQQFSLVHTDRYLDFASQISLNIPNSTSIYSVIHKQATGKVWLNSNDELLVISGTNTPFATYTGELTPIPFSEIINLLSEYQACELVIKNNSLSNRDIEFMSQNGYKFINRRRLINDELTTTKNIDLEINNFKLIKINTRERLKICQQHDELLDFYGNYENYLKHSQGFALLDLSTGIIASEVHLFLSNDVAEPTISTKMEYRNQGLSFYLSSHALAYSIKNKLVYEWSCDDYNFSSLNIATKLGLQQLECYTMFCRDSRSKA